MLTRKRFLKDLTSLLTLSLIVAAGAIVASGQALPRAVTEPSAEPGPTATSGNSQEAAVAKIEATAKPASEKSDPVPAPPTRTAAPQIPPTCQRMVNADVVALPQPIMLNRLGAAIPDGLVFALASDTELTGSGANAQYQLKANKRPRPLVLRANVGDCLKIRLTNGIPTNKFITTAMPGASTGTTEVSLHVQGMEWVTGPGDDGSYVGTNNSSLASAPPPPSPTPSPMPPSTQTYTLFAKAEGTFMMYTVGDTSTNGDQLTRGLFGAVNIQPSGAEWYRSQVSADDLLLATYNANRLPTNSSLVCTPPDGPKCKFTVNNKTVDVIKTPDFGSGTALIKGGYLNTLDNHPLIQYDAVFPPGPDGTNIPVLNMLVKLSNGEYKIVHSDLTAMITGPNAGRFPGANGNPNQPDPPCNAAALNPAVFCANPASPDRKQPYREITVIYHGGLGPIAQQAFPILANAPATNATPAQKQLAFMSQAGQDAFAINYGTGGIGAEIYANRIGVGPMADCVDCKFEEFFLSAWSVGDPAMLVDRPANTNIKPADPFPGPFNAAPAMPLVPPPPPVCTSAQLDNPADPNHLNCTGTRTPATGFPYTMTPLPKATRAYYPDDPSNVYHSYINDHVKFRILHGGRDVTHVHHQHAHQWLQSPNSDESSYLDSQMISPGASYTLEMVYNGSGNRNKVVGDSIFHCHFYPHFAAGMWAMWRTHDVFESGTFVYPFGTEVNGQDVSNQVVPGARALPDGEIITGVPTPAIVPLPTLPMAPLPAYAQIKNNVPVAGSPTPITIGGQVVIGGTCKANQVNGLDVIGGCPDGANVNGTVIHSQYSVARVKMVGQLQPSTTLMNPGFPYFIPGIAGARAPHPPLDFAKDASGFLDGGLPRHVVTGGSIKFESHSLTDWSKDLATMSALQLPEEGTKVEQAAMTYFGKRCYPTFFPDGTPGSCPSSNSIRPQSTLVSPPTGFILNGLPRKNPAGNSAEKLGATPGAPFADPAITDNGVATGTLRRYKAAAIQLDVTLNKAGWHYPQQRMLTLWGDVVPTLKYQFGNPSSGRKPEPLFFRGNTGDIIEYWHTNLVPNYFELDAFQVRTPTDILGQHIHLVKFDVTSSDGAGNGFNYEDGTFSPEEVQDIIKALNDAKAADPTKGWTPCSGCSATLRPPQPPPAQICGGPNPPAQCAHEWLGAQTTIQRWYLDPLVDELDVDRTLRTVFTHDHFGPSTHQQAGLYAGLLVEPLGSTWTSNDGTQTFGSRFDGGPTSWEARILTRNAADSYREFMLEFQDLQLAYQPLKQGTPGPIAGPFYDQQGSPINPPMVTGTTTIQPTLVTTGIPSVPAGTQSVNYSNDPIALRLGDPSVFPPPSKFSDLSYVYDNSVYSQLHPGKPADPATPVMRAYQNDKVQVRVLVGAHVFAHQFLFEGPTWFAEPSWKNSGYRSIQAMGLSEHFEFLFNVPSSSAASTGRKCPDGMSQANCTDYLYSPSFDQFGLTNGLWGLFRAYTPTKLATGVKPLPNNPVSASTNVSYVTCPANATKRVFNISAVTAQKALSVRSPISGTSKGQIVLNNRGNPNDQLAVIYPSGGPVPQTTGIMYVRNADLDANGLLLPNAPIEPLILRANAGDCIEINLTNKIDPTGADLYAHNFAMATPFNIPPFPSKSSRYVGLNPQLLSYDAAKSYGMNVGWNSQGQTDQVVPFGQSIKYQWFAGKISRNPNGSLKHDAVEFGSLNLFPSDPLFQNINGLFGQMIIEPFGTKKIQCGEAANLADCEPPPLPLPGNPPAVYPPTSRASATVTMADGSKFRDFAVMISDAMISNNNNPSQPVQALGAVNYGTEPFPAPAQNPPAAPWSFRYGRGRFASGTPTAFPTSDFSCMQSNNLIQPTAQDPKTPIFTAAVGDKVRFRFAHPFGTGASQVMTVHGHVWQRNPYTKNSTVIGSNNLSQWIGSRDNHGSGDHFEIVIDKAGGESGRAGDYLYIGFAPLQAKQGAWGLFRVGNVNNNPPLKPNAACSQVLPPPAQYAVPAKDDDLDRFNRRPFGAEKPKPQP